MGLSSIQTSRPTIEDQETEIEIEMETEMKRTEKKKAWSSSRRVKRCFCALQLFPVLLPVRLFRSDVEGEKKDSMLMIFPLCRCEDLLLFLLDRGQIHSSREERKKRTTIQKKTMKTKKTTKTKTKREKKRREKKRKERKREKEGRRFWGVGSLVWF